MTASTDPHPVAGRGYKRISGRFRYALDMFGEGLTFVWDSAALGPEGDIVLIEEEMAEPVLIHIQGHVVRAGYMLAAGERITKLVWVVPPPHFQDLWAIVEPWRRALRDRLEVATPPCEYLTPEGVRLAVSPDYR